MAARVLVNDQDERCIALATESNVLFFHPQPGADDEISIRSFRPHDQNSTIAPAIVPRCAVELSDAETANLAGFTKLSTRKCYGCLGLIGLGRDIFICIITNSQQVATLKPDEHVSRISGVEFYCLNRPDYDHLLQSEVNSYPVEADGWDQGRSQQPIGMEHPCLALRKLLGDGTFYYSTEFDLTNRLQDRSVNATTFDIAQFDDSFMWNSFMINPLLEFRSRLTKYEATMLDESRLLTCVIRGFVETLSIQKPVSRSPEKRVRQVGLPAYMTLISRLSCRRAGTRFNSRGIDDDGNVANFVETETIIWNPHSSKNQQPVEFSYCQVRGSVPIFWEQQTGFLPNQQKIQLTRSPEATQPAFDKHMEGLVLKYGSAHIVNLLSETKSGEVDLSDRYRYHANHSSMSVDSRGREKRMTASLLLNTEYDFHAETRAGYEATSSLKPILEESSDAFGYFLIEDLPVGEQGPTQSTVTVLQQEGVFRTNCLDCLDRTNVVQGILSRTAIESFLDHLGEVLAHEFWVQHNTIWADNGDALSKIYAGTGALKSSFTRTGKTSIAGKLADMRKSATRVYINNFEDKDRQNTIDVLLGRLIGSQPVDLFDPVNDYVTAELARRAAEYTSEKHISIYVGTFNLNGQTVGLNHDLSEWLIPNFVEKFQGRPEIVVVGFQEIVELSPQQIMSTDPAIRQLWEKAVLRCLNEDSEDPYVLLRGGQLVGAALLIFVRKSSINYIKNVEGSLKKTGLSGVAGNKGAVAIRLDFANTRLCFVTAHLAAGFSNTDERNRDYQTIATGLRFQKERTIDNHDGVIWLGDFNYRIGLPDEHVRRLIDRGDLQSLYDNDQLYLQMIKGYTFPFYTESTITFDPTYKFDLGHDVYDTSEKARIPAWCDRILWKGDLLQQLSYGSTQTIRFSDHRPVYGTFRCAVTIVDEEAKDKLSKQLYSERKKGRKGIRQKSLLDSESDDEGDLLNMEPLRTGLPTPSSDRQKWWLDGQPAKAFPTPPSDQYILNPARSSNPFSEHSPSSEPEWVRVDPPPSIRSLSSSDSSSLPRTPVVRKLPPPYNPANTPIPALAARKPVPVADVRTERKILPPPLEPVTKHIMRAPPPPERVLVAPPYQDTPPPVPIASRPPTQQAKIVKKQPPPKPAKPVTLTKSQRDAFAPPQRRGTDGPEFAPKLPQRTNTVSGDLMDSDDCELGGWDALKPA